MNSGGWNRSAWPTAGSRPRPGDTRRESECALIHCFPSDVSGYRSPTHRYSPPTGVRSLLGCDAGVDRVCGDLDGRHSSGPIADRVHGHRRLPSGRRSARPSAGHQPVRKAERSLWPTAHHGGGPARIRPGSRPRTRGRGPRVVLVAGGRSGVRRSGYRSYSPGPVHGSRTQRGAPARSGGRAPGVVGHAGVSGGSQPRRRCRPDDRGLAGHGIWRRLPAGPRRVPSLLVALSGSSPSRPFPGGRHHPSDAGRPGLGGLCSPASGGATLHPGLALRSRSNGAGDDRHPAAYR